jgi:hypothetical protein
VFDTEEGISRSFGELMALMDGQTDLRFARYFKQCLHAAVAAHPLLLKTGSNDARKSGPRAGQCAVRTHFSDEQRRACITSHNGPC